MESVRELRSEEVAACEGILAGLPEWFGIAASNREFVEGLSRLPAAVALVDGRVAGFVSVLLHGPRSAEIHVMAVERRLHRRGIGGALLEWVERWCRENRVRWLHVKTRAPATPDPAYERTRRFYRRRGFDPLFESLTLWGPEDAALVLVRRIPDPDPQPEGRSR